MTGPDGLELHTVSRDAVGLEVSPVLALDMTRPLADLRFSGVASSPVGPAGAALRLALDTGAALLASEQLGWRSGVSTPRWLTSSSASSSAARSAPTRRSSIGWPICGWRSARPPRRPGTPRTPALEAMKTRHRRGHRAGLLQRRRRARRRGVRTAARRYRDDLGVSGAPVSQSGQERPVGARHRLSASGPIG